VHSLDGSEKVEKFPRVLVGCFGAVLPESLRFFKLAAARQRLPNLNWPIHIGLLVRVVLAAGAFTAWKAEMQFKAIRVGASFPTLAHAIPIGPQAKCSMPGAKAPHKSLTRQIAEDGDSSLALGIRLLVPRGGLEPPQALRPCRF